jgi:hypothetical protein
MPVDGGSDDIKISGKDRLNLLKQLVVVVGQQHTHSAQRRHPVDLLFLHWNHLNRLSAENPTPIRFP